MPSPLLPRTRLYWPIIIGILPALAIGMWAQKPLFAGYVRAANAFAETGTTWSGLSVALPDLGPASLLVLRLIAAFAHTDAAVRFGLVLFGVLASMGAALVVARSVEGRLGEMQAMWCVAAIALNPGLMLVNGLLGPFDIAAALCVLIATIALARGNLAAACFGALAGSAFTPVPLALVALLVFAPLLYHGEARARAWRQCARGSAAGLALLALSAAFFAADYHPIEGLAWLVGHYPDGITSYHFNTAGAFNIYALFGAMWQPERIGMWGYAILAAFAIGTGAAYVRERRPEHAPLTVFLLMFALFIFAPRVFAPQLAYAVVLAPLTLALGKRAVAATLVLAATLSVNAICVALKLNIPLAQHGLALLNVAAFFLLAHAFATKLQPGLDLSTPIARAQPVQPLAASDEAANEDPKGARMTVLDYTSVTGLMIVFLASAYFQFWEPPSKNFDEIYYVRAGAEYLQHKEIFESTHPPLTKLIIAASMLVGGDKPFGWRLFNLLVGTLQIGVVYLFARRWLRSSTFAALAAAMVAFDGFHFAQSRIATPEITVAFFTMLTLYCFYRYWTAGSAAGVISVPLTNVWRHLAMAALIGAPSGSALFWYASPAARTLAGAYISLVAFALTTFMAYRRTVRSDPAQREPSRWFWATTISMGALASCKWNGLFTLAALVAIFAFVQLYRRVRERDSWGRFAGVPVVAFLPSIIAVAATMYLTAYIPYFFLGHGIDEFISLQQGMYRYHSTLVATHPYSSVWWQWPLILRPIAYYLHDTSSAANPCCIAIIFALPNPITWWTGLISVPYAAVIGWIERNKGATLLAAAYFAQWLPWIFSPRLSFEYHFFPNAALIALANAFLLQRLWTRAPTPYRRGVRFAIAAYACAALAAFVYWYPVVAGLPLNKGAYDARMLHWLMGNRWT